MILERISGRGPPPYDSNCFPIPSSSSTSVRTNETQPTWSASNAAGGHAMKRATVLLALLAIGSVSLAVKAYQAPPAGGGQQQPKVVEVEKIKDNLYMLKGGGGN